MYELCSLKNMKPLLIDQPTLANCFEQNLDSIEVLSTGSFNGFYKPIWGHAKQY